jgi:hypothetical protein
MLSLSIMQSMCLAQSFVLLQLCLAFTADDGAFNSCSLSKILVLSTPACWQDMNNTAFHAVTRMSGTPVECEMQLCMTCYVFLQHTFKYDKDMEK